MTDTRTDTGMGTGDLPGPFVRFGRWLAEAEKSEINDPNAMALATADAQGRPNLRMVLLKGWDERGFVFYTNRESAKGGELLSRPHVALCWHWKSLRRQVRVRGRAAEVDAAEADAYFASRPRDSRIGAWASAQSRPMEGRFVLEKAVARYGAKFALGPVPRPPYWTGFRVAPFEMEFWRDRPFRLHDRLVYRLGDGGWTEERLFP